MNPTTTLAQLKQQPQTAAVKMGFSDKESFELMQRAANLLSAAQLVPKEYQGNLPNCVIALNMANRIGADPLMVMQNLIVIHGKPTWSSQFLIATVNTCGRFSALRYEFFGEPNTDSWGCRAWAVEKETGEKLVGTDITIGIAKSEGWYNKNGSKWKTIPQQMLMYRAGSWWARAYAPELSMGLSTAEEMGDIIDVDVKTGEVIGTSTEKLKRGMKKVQEQVDDVSQPLAEDAQSDTQTVKLIPTDLEFEAILNDISTGNISTDSVLAQYDLTDEQRAEVDKL